MFWKQEHIPDEDDIYRRIPPSQYNPKTGRFVPPVFKLRPWKNERAASVDWSKYSTPEKTSFDTNTKREYLVGGIYAKVPRSLGLEVIHRPGKNRAHSLITGTKLIDDDLETLDTLTQNCRPLIIC